MVDSLRPCPFCGGDVVGAHEISDGAGYGLFEIFCLGPNKSGPGCGAVTTSHATEVEATAAWNTRTKAISRTGAVNALPERAPYEILQVLGRAYETSGEMWAAIRSVLSALEPAAPDVIAKGLLSDADAKAAKLGKFGHHPDPAIDFEIEVESLQARLIDAKGGISKPGTEPEAPAAVLADIERAMTFRVGGDPSAVRAKQMLRDLEADAKQAVQPAAPEGQQEAAEADRIRREMEGILRRQSERDIPFAPATRPSEQAVTEAARAVCDNAKLVDIGKNGAFNYVVSPYLIDALKAAMEEGRHD